MCLLAQPSICAELNSAVLEEMARTHSLIDNVPESVQSDLAGSQICLVNSTCLAILETQTSSVSTYNAGLFHS